MKAPSFAGLKPTSEGQSRAKRASKGKNTSIERLLRSALHSRGARFRVGGCGLVGKPDVVFPASKLAVFCDGDFWHGKNWPDLSERLSAGSNAPYWTSKIAYNVERDARVTRELEDQGWKVLRFWESDIRADVGRIAQDVHSQVVSRSPRSRFTTTPRN